MLRRKVQASGSGSGNGSGSGSGSRTPRIPGTMVGFTTIGNHRFDVYQNGEKKAYYPMYNKRQRWYPYSNGQGGYMSFASEHGVRLFFEQRNRARTGWR